MDTLNPATLEALAEVPPDVLRALKDVPPAVLAGLAEARPEKSAVLGETPERDSSASPWADSTDAPEVLGERLVEAMKLALVGRGDILGFFGKYHGHRWWSIGYDLGGNETVGKLLALPDYEVAQVLSVLGSEVRLAMLRSLLQSPKNAAELVAELRLGTTGQAYHHLRELERAGYLEQREGRYQFVERFIRLYLTALALASDAGAEASEEAGEPVDHELAEAKKSAVAAIGRRNQLRNELQRQQRKAAQFEANARTALKQGNEELARQLLTEKSPIDSLVAALAAELAQAEQAAAAVKKSIREQVERTARRLNLPVAKRQNGGGADQVEEVLQRMKAELGLEPARPG